MGNPKSMPPVRCALFVALNAIALPAWAQQAERSATELDRITVHGDADAPVQAAKMDVPLLEIPQAISIVDSDLLRRQGITRLADAMRNVAGASRSSTYGYYDAYQLRGFDAAYGSLYLDGLTSGNVAGAVNELAGIERVEVVKGPASSLFGASPLGGVVNLVSKRPQRDAFVDASVAAGGWNLREATLDANAPLVASGALLGRVNLAYRDGDDFVDFSSKHRVYVAPALTWAIGEDTRLTVLARYQRDDDSPWSPVNAWGTLLPNANGRVPVSQSVNNNGPNAAYFDQRARQIGYILDHRFNDAVSFSQTVRYERRDVSWDRWIFTAGFVDNDIVDGVQHGRVIGRYVYGPFQQRDYDFAGDSRLTVEFASGPLHHQLVFGFDYHRNSNRYASGAGNFNADQNPLDLFDPDYSQPFVRDPDSAYTGNDSSRQTGVYLRDLIQVGDRLGFIVGGRQDQALAGVQSDSKFSPQAGATWALDAQSSLYASWSRSFTPNGAWATRFDGSLLPPETGENKEIGYKVQAHDGRLSGMVSVFNLVRQNVATDDPQHPMFYVVTGEQRSRGIEVEGGWLPTAAWELRGAYAYLDAEVTQDTTLPVGIPLANVPRNSASLWGKYTVQAGALQGLGLSLGAVYNSDKHFYEYGDRLYTLPSYTLIDAGVSYAFGTAELQLTASNLTDRRYFPDAAGLDRVTPGEPRNWRLSVRYRF